ncbi:Uncharacterised protein [Mycobacteroides abscessus subsp. abscessus]|nr:Uncharacterised protein [Mycobacteroides abscessus subsp. abscessus]
MCSGGASKPVSIMSLTMTNSSSSLMSLSRFFTTLFSESRRTWSRIGASSDALPE